MAEQRLSELVEHLIDWIESLHEKNLKYQAQVKTLSRDLAKAQTSNEQLEARLSAYQNASDIKQPSVIATTQVPQVPNHLTNHLSNLHDSSQLTQPELHTPTLDHHHHHHHHSHMEQQQQALTTPQQHQHSQQQQQAPIYAQQMHNPQTFVPQPQYVWTTYDTSGQVPYYTDQYAGAPAVSAPATFQQPQKIQLTNSHTLIVGIDKEDKYTMACKIDFINNWELRYQGAESRLYFGVHSNNRCVIKHRFSKKYRHPLLDRKLTKERTKRERRVIDKVRAKSKELAEYMPKVVWSDDGTILMTEITDCLPVCDYIERDHSKAAEIAPLIGRCIAELHNIGIIHGDLTTSNLLLLPRNRKNEVVPSKKVKSNEFEESHIVIPIDFGLSTGSEHPEEKAVDLYVLERALLSTHFSDSIFFNRVIEAYLETIDDATCEPLGKQKIIERLQEVRGRGRKSEYANDQEA